MVLNFMGMISPPTDPATARSARKSLEKGRERYRFGDYESSFPYFMDAMRDFGNIDYVVYRARSMPDNVLGLRLLEAAEAKGREFLGAECFDDNDQYVGHFWGLLDTRPYMRTLSGIAHTAYKLN